MALDKKGTYKKDLIICLIGVLLEFGFGPLVGEFQGVTQVGSNCIGVFLGVILMTVRQYNVIPLFMKMPCIAMAKDHPLAARKSVSMQSLKYETFVMSAMLSKVGIQHDSFVNLCISSGFEPKIRSLPVETYAETRDAAVASKGWMYPTFQTRSMGNDDIAFVPLEDPSYYCIYYMITPKETNKATDIIADMMLRHLTKNDDTCYPIL